jgi:hypothetical protein
LLAAGLVLGGWSSAAAWAAAPVQVHSDGDCPSAAQVSAALDYLFRDAPAAAGVGSGGPLPELAVVDLGAGYRVSFEGQAREYADAARGCEERARVAAVFAAVVLEPPEVAERARAVAPVTPVPARTAPGGFELRAGGVLDVGPRQGGSALSSGGELRIAATGRRWGLELGAGARAPARLTWGSYQAQLTRFPFDVDARVVWRRPHLTTTAATGLVATVIDLRGEGTAVGAPASGTRLDLGARAALSLQFLQSPSAWLSPFVALQASVSPRPYRAIVDPVGQIGTAPWAWVGATLGVAVALR